ncbi:CGNR zinc finger domain-containing protein [Pseudomonas baltica]|uniref:ABATE domain-containing protein n=1 Tax=Pseudomonas baltica TaxID=2762576 RepID=A0A7X1G348_9PSED|nr:ABATE domain-containing protein [Pseudomonas baltica]MBC2677616.1 ABATE domain-containing protein [Pseudomonas baltica]
MNLTAIAPDTLFVADNLALDFINTQYGVGDQQHDCLRDDEDVLKWLDAAGLPARHDQADTARGLLTQALALRACAKGLVNAAMTGEEADPEVVNQILEAGRPVSGLQWNGAAPAFRIEVQPRDAGSASLLWPVADALARLVTGDTFEFVRQCEAHDCVLFFHDLSKSHRRRWCSMATCGNRMKVAAFRSRKKPE